MVGFFKSYCYYANIEFLLLKIKKHSIQSIIPISRFYIQAMATTNKMHFKNVQDDIFGGITVATIVPVSSFDL